jgi:hypothetical protein
MTEGCTPLEVHEVLKLRDFDVVVRCLEVVRLNLPSILPAGARYRVEVMPMCHHHSDNCYPVFGVFGPHTWAEFELAETLINDWVTERGMDWLVTESEGVAAPSWGQLAVGLLPRKA